MDAIIFDIDGTLIASDDVDGALYVAAVRQVLGPVHIRPDWNSYGNVSDSGILDEILTDNGVPRDQEIIGSVREVFVESLRTHLNVNGPFPEVPGARNFVRSVTQSDHHVCAYATGGWSASARMKLETAGFPMTEVPLASADDSPIRREIMESALRQLGPCDNVTYYGDGPWDREATAALGWRFVAVGAKLRGISRFEPHGA